MEEHSERGYNSFFKRLVDMIKNKVFSNIVYLVSSSLITKIVLFLFYIYVARILGPNGYGYISSSTEYLGLFLIFATFGLQMAIVREASRNSDNQIGLFNKILPARFVFSIISFVFCITIVIFYIGIRLIFI